MLMKYSNTVCSNNALMIKSLKNVFSFTFVLVFLKSFCWKKKTNKNMLNQTTAIKNLTVKLMNKKIYRLSKNRLKKRISNCTYLNKKFDDLN